MFQGTQATTITRCKYCQRPIFLKKKGTLMIPIENARACADWVRKRNEAKNKINYYEK